MSIQLKKIVTDFILLKNKTHEKLMLLVKDSLNQKIIFSYNENYLATFNYFASFLTNEEHQHYLPIEVHLVSIFIDSDEQLTFEGINIHNNESIFVGYKDIDLESIMDLITRKYID